jgi:hypothetical protein
MREADDLESLSLDTNGPLSFEKDSISWCSCIHLWLILRSYGLMTDIPMRDVGEEIRSLEWRVTLQGPGASEFPHLLGIRTPISLAKALWLVAL